MLNVAAFGKGAVITTSRIEEDNIMLTLRFFSLITICSRLPSKILKFSRSSTVNHRNCDKLSVKLLSYENVKSSILVYIVRFKTVRSFEKEESKTFPYTEE